MDRVRRNAPRVEPHVDGAGRIVVLLYVCGAGEASWSFSRIWRPYGSLPTALTTADRQPNCAAWNAKLSVAPPSCLPEGSRSPQEFPDACYGECLFHTCKFSNPRGNCKRRPTFLFTGFCGSSARPIS